MKLRSRLVLPGYLLACSLLYSCASTEVASYSALTPEDVAAEVVVTRREGDLAGYDIAGPRIDERAGFGKFATGMLTGGSDFGSAIALRGELTDTAPAIHRIVAEVQYTNLGGVYRRYDRAGIAGIEKLDVVLMDSQRHYNINSVNMTEVLGIIISESDLRARASTGLLLRLSDDSNNLAEFTIPANYIAGYLLSVERAAGSENPI